MFYFTKTLSRRPARKFVRTLLVATLSFALTIPPVTPGPQAGIFTELAKVHGGDEALDAANSAALDFAKKIEAIDPDVGAQLRKDIESGKFRKQLELGVSVSEDLTSTYLQEGIKGAAALKSSDVNARGNSGALMSLLINSGDLACGLGIIAARARLLKHMIKNLNNKGAFVKAQALLDYMNKMNYICRKKGFLGGLQEGKKQDAKAGGDATPELSEEEKAIQAEIKKIKSFTKIERECYIILKELEALYIEKLYAGFGDGESITPHDFNSRYYSLKALIKSATDKIGGHEINKANAQARLDATPEVSAAKLNAATKTYNRLRRFTRVMVHKDRLKYEAAQDTIRQAERRAKAEADLAKHDAEIAKLKEQIEKARKEMTELSKKLANHLKKIELIRQRILKLAKPCGEKFDEFAKADNFDHLKTVPRRSGGKNKDLRPEDAELIDGIIKGYEPLKKFVSVLKTPISFETHVKETHVCVATEYTTTVGEGMETLRTVVYAPGEEPPENDGYISFPDGSVYIAEDGETTEGGGPVVVVPPEPTSETTSTPGETPPNEPTPETPPAETTVVVTEEEKQETTTGGEIPPGDGPKPEPLPVVPPVGEPVVVAGGDPAQGPGETPPNQPTGDPTPETPPNDGEKTVERPPEGDPDPQPEPVPDLGLAKATASVVAAAVTVTGGSAGPGAAVIGASIQFTQAAPALPGEEIALLSGIEGVTEDELIVADLAMTSEDNYQNDVPSGLTGDDGQIVLASNQGNNGGGLGGLFSGLFDKDLSDTIPVPIGDPLAASGQQSADNVVLNFPDQSPDGNAIGSGGTDVRLGLNNGLSRLDGTDLSDVISVPIGDPLATTGQQNANGGLLKGLPPAPDLSEPDRNTNGSDGTDGFFDGSNLGRIQTGQADGSIGNTIGPASQPQQDGDGSDLEELGDSDVFIGGSTYREPNAAANGSIDPEGLDEDPNDLDIAQQNGGGQETKLQYARFSLNNVVVEQATATPESSNGTSSETELVSVSLNLELSETEAKPPIVKTFDSVGDFMEFHRIEGHQGKIDRSILEKIDKSSRSGRPSRVFRIGEKLAAVYKQYAGAFEEYSKQLATNQHVSYVEEDPCRNKEEDDPYFAGSGAWGQDFDDQWAIKRSGLDFADPEGLEPVTVAVIDSGVDWFHPDLPQSSLWRNQGEIPANGIDDDGNGYVDDLIGWNFIDDDKSPWDQDGHGTFVAGVIAAGSNNGTGIMGINPAARIMALKALDAFGNGHASMIAEAIAYAVDNGAKVINLSLGGRKFTEVERLAIEHANDNGVLVVAAAGNLGASVADYSPAGLQGVVTVTATDRNDNRAGFSNWGPAVDIAAPGVDVLSLRARNTDLLAHIPDVTYETGAGVVGEDRAYFRASGTSFAAPIVAGTASLILARNPDLTAGQVRQMILNSAKDIDVAGIDNFTGYGLLDARAALSADPDYYITARISGVKVVKVKDQLALRISGSADANNLAQARLQLGPGEKPEKWYSVKSVISEPKIETSLMVLPAKVFQSAPKWTLKLIVEHADGTKREATFALSLG